MIRKRRRRRRIKRSRKRRRRRRKEENDKKEEEEELNVCNILRFPGPRRRGKNTPDIVSRIPGGGRINGV